MLDLFFLWTERAQKVSKAAYFTRTLTVSVPQFTI